MERIFCDKLLAAEFYVQREEYFDVAKHLYDIAAMIEMPRVQRMLGDKTALIKYLSYKRIEETIRAGSDLSHKPFSDFRLFDAVIHNGKFEMAFEDMQRKYIFQDEYRKEIQDIKDVVLTLKEILLKLDAVEQQELSSSDFMNRITEYNPDFAEAAKKEIKVGQDISSVRRRRGR